jgi:hypothetical protein
LGFLLGSHNWLIMATILEVGPELCFRLATFVKADGQAAWQEVFRGIETGTLAANAILATSFERITLLHYAALRCSAATMQRLLQLGASPYVLDSNGCVPMYYVMFSCKDVVSKCKMLPCEQLFTIGGHEFYPTLFHMAVSCQHVGGWQRIELLQWMVEQAECPLEVPLETGVTVLQVLERNGREAAHAVVVAAMALRARWSCARAAWTGAVATAGCGARTIALSLT